MSGAVDPGTGEAREPSTFLVGTSWKMNKTRGEAVGWLRRVRASSGDRHVLQRFVIPPFTALDAVRTALDGSDILLGAQNVHEAEQGAHTGEISAAMLVDVGCTLVEIGHSERRADAGETDTRVRAKTRQLLRHGLRPLVCVGDSRAERDVSAHVAAVLRQAQFALEGLADEARRRCLLAYEPVWAIGEGSDTASTDEVAEMHRALKVRFPDVTVLYGGSVDAASAAPLAALDDVDGLFVGRAALDPEGFVAVLDAALDACERAFR